MIWYNLYFKNEHLQNFLLPNFNLKYDRDMNVSPEYVLLVLRLKCISAFLGLPNFDVKYEYNHLKEYQGYTIL